MAFNCEVVGGRMPKVKTNRIKYPAGWELIEPSLRELDAKMREGWWHVWCCYHLDLVKLFPFFLNLFILNVL